MFELEKTFRFEAGHSLVHHDGKCRTPHGHSYKLAITIRAPDLVQSGPKKNMVMDYRDVAAVVTPMLDKYFDHKWINDTLHSDSATVEFMAKWIFDYLTPLLPGLYSVTLWETETCKATYIRPLK